jgi:hypothetical protein
MESINNCSEQTTWQRIREDGKVVGKFDVERWKMTDGVREENNC